jgi:fructokinase
MALIQVLCFGEALVDRLGPQADYLGGAPANGACALARLGTPVAWLGRLGNDAIGQRFAELFVDRGVNTAGLQWDQERPSRVVLVQRDATGERAFAGFAGDRGLGFADQAVDQRALAAVVEPAFGYAQWLLVGTLALASLASSEALTWLLQWAKTAGVALAVDVNWRPTFWDPASPPESGPAPAAIAQIRPLLEQAALIKCAAEEAQWLFGNQDPGLISAALSQRPVVVVSDGANPLRWCWGGQAGSLEAFAVPVVDTTGAGDAFTAGLLHRLCAQPELRQRELIGAGSVADVREIMRFASACGALVCQGEGAIDPQPTEAAVGAFLSGRPG